VMPPLIRMVSPWLKVAVSLMAATAISPQIVRYLSDLFLCHRFTSFHTSFYRTIDPLSTLSIA